VAEVIAAPKRRTSTSSVALPAIESLPSRWAPGLGMQFLGEWMAGLGKPVMVSDRSTLVSRGSSQPAGEPQEKSARSDVQKHAPCVEVDAKLVRAPYERVAPDAKAKFFTPPAKTGLFDSAEKIAAMRRKKIIEVRPEDLATRIAQQASHWTQNPVAMEQMRSLSTVSVMPVLPQRLTQFHGSQVPIVIVYFLRSTELARLAQADQFWRRNIGVEAVWSGLHCRDYCGAMCFESDVCVWSTMHGNEGAPRCLYHMSTVDNREFKAMCKRITGIPGRSAEELRSAYLAWRKQLNYQSSFMSNLEGTAEFAKRWNNLRTEAELLRAQLVLQKEAGKFKQVMVQLAAEALSDGVSSNDDDSSPHRRSPKTRSGRRLRRCCLYSQSYSNASDFAARSLTTRSASRRDAASCRRCCCAQHQATGLSPAQQRPPTLQTSPAPPTPPTPGTPQSPRTPRTPQRQGTQKRRKDVVSPLC